MYVSSQQQSSYKFLKSYQPIPVFPSCKALFLFLYLYRRNLLFIIHLFVARINHNSKKLPKNLMFYDRTKVAGQTSFLKLSF